MIPAPLDEISADPSGAVADKAYDVASSMFTQPIDDPLIFSAQADSWLQAFAGPNQASEVISDTQTYYRKARGAWNYPWQSLLALRSNP